MMPGSFNWQNNISQNVKVNHFGKKKEQTCSILQLQTGLWACLTLTGTSSMLSDFAASSSTSKSSSRSLQHADLLLGQALKNSDLNDRRKDMQGLFCIICFSFTVFRLAPILLSHAPRPGIWMCNLITRNVSGRWAATSHHSRIYWYQLLNLLRITKVF